MISQQPSGFKCKESWISGWNLPPGLRCSPSVVQIRFTFQNDHTRKGFDNAGHERVPCYRPQITELTTKLLYWQIGVLNGCISEEAAVRTIELFEDLFIGMEIVGVNKAVGRVSAAKHLHSMSIGAAARIEDNKRGEKVTSGEARSWLESGPPGRHFLGRFLKKIAVQCHRE